MNGADVPASVPLWAKRCDSDSLMVWDSWISNGFFAVLTDEDLGEHGWFAKECTCKDRDRHACCRRGNWCGIGRGFPCQSKAWRKTDLLMRKAVDPSRIAEDRNLVPVGAVVLNAATRLSSEGLTLISAAYGSDRKCAIQSRFYDLIQEIAKPDSWAALVLPELFEPSRFHGPRDRWDSPPIAAMRGGEYVGFIMPVHIGDLEADA